MRRRVCSWQPGSDGKQTIQGVWCMMSSNLSSMYQIACTFLSCIRLCDVQIARGSFKFEVGLVCGWRSNRGCNKQLSRRVSNVNKCFVYILNCMMYFLRYHLLSVWLIQYCFGFFLFCQTRTIRPREIKNIGNSGNFLTNWPSIAASRTGALKLRKSSLKLAPSTFLLLIRAISC